MYIKRDYDGNGEVLYRKPKFFIVETGEYIVLNTKEVSKGKKYTIKYYPNTKICEVTEYIEYTSKSQAKGNGFQALRAKMDIIDDANGLKGELVKFGEY